MTSCSENEKSTPEKVSANELYQVKYAVAFSFLKSKNEEVILKVSDPNNPKLVWQYSLASDKPKEGCQPLPYSPKRVSALSSTHIGMMKALNLTNKIAAISSKSYWCDLEQTEKELLQKIYELGDGGESNVEQFLTAKTDLVIHAGFDPSSPILKKLSQANIPVLMNYDWKETHPLGRAEWIKVFGFIFGMEEEANALFNEIEDAYLKAIQNVAKETFFKTVLVGTMYGDIFNAPAGESYMAKLMKDAGANYVYGQTEGVGSLNISLESLISNNSATEIWLNAAATNIKQILQINNKFSHLSSVSNRKVFSYYHDVNCFWEQSAISPHLVIQDIVNIISDTKFVKGHFYKRLN
ncbi:MAG: ABC transporter substrate-binding protein [Crocinitomicaceae bacterium]|nr:ABC transporter substrate-binding protein [Crocinitomicaceae bacterium]